MSSRVRKRSLGWRSQDPLGGGPKRENQITEHACSRSTIYSLWTGSSMALASTSMLTHLHRWVSLIAGQDFAGPHDCIRYATAVWLAGGCSMERISCGRWHTFSCHLTVHTRRHVRVT